MSTSDHEEQAQGHGSKPPSVPVAVKDNSVVDVLQRFIARCIEATARVTEPSKVARLSYATGRACEELLGDQERAEECYLEAFGRDPEFGPNLKAARRLKAVAGDWRAVLDLLDAEMRRGGLTPEAQAEAYLERGSILEGLKDLDGAREAYTCAMELDEHNPLLWLRLSGVLVKGQAWAELDEMLSRVLVYVELPSLRSVLLGRRASITAERLDDPQKAIGFYEDALELRPDLVEAFTGLKRLYKTNNCWSELVELCKRELKLLDGPAKVHSYYQVARLATRRLGRADLAIEYLEKAAQFEPEEVLVLSELGRLYEQVARNVEQLSINEKLLELSKDPVEKLELCYRLGRICEEHLDDDDRAALFYRRAVELRPGFGPAMQALGRLYRKHGRLEELLEMHFIEAKQAADVDHQALAHYRAGELLETQLSRVDIAVDQYEEAVRWVPSFLPAQRALNRLYAKLERWEELIQLQEKEAESLRGGSFVGERQDPLRVARLEQIGRLWEDKVGNLERAAETYQRILELDPGYMGALFALQRIYEKAEKWSELMELLEREVELIEDEGWVAALLHQIGEIAEEKLDDRDLAVLYYRRALAIRPAYVPTLTNLGRIYTEQGRFSDVLALYIKEAEVTENMQRQATIAFRMGAIYENRLEEVDKAEESYRRALERDPELWPALQALERLLSRRRRWEELAEVLEGQARLIESPLARAVAFFRVGELCEERLGKLDAAWDVYNQALRASPAYYPARVALARLSRQRGGMAQLADVLSDQLGSVGDGFAALEVLVELGDLWRYDLDAEEQALEAYSEMIALAPAQLYALISLFELRRGQGEYDELADVCRHLASACDDPMLKVGVLRELAEILESHVDDPAEAKEVWAEILSLRSEDIAARRALGADVGESEPIEVLPADVAVAIELLSALAVEEQSDIGKALEAFEAMYAVEQDWDGLVTALDAILDHFENSPIRRALMILKARVLGEHLGEVPRAEKLLRTIEDEDPDDIELRGALATILAGDESRRNEAIAEHQSLLYVDPCRLASVQALESLWRQTDEPDRAHCALGVLSCFMAASTEQLEAYNKQRRVLGDDRGRTVRRDELVKLVVSQGDRPPPQEALELLSILQPHLSEVYPPDLGAFGLTPDDCIPPPDRHPLRTRGELVGWLLDIPIFDVFLHQVPGKAESVELSEPPAIVLPTSVESWTPSQQLYVIGCLMGGVKLGTWIAEKISPRELEMLLVAATRIHVPAFHSNDEDTEAVDSLRRKLERIVPEDVQNDLVDSAKALAERGDEPIDYEAWLTDMKAVSQRVGLLACGDLADAFTMVLREDPAIEGGPRETTADVVKLCTSSEKLRELVRWYLSDEYFALRKIAGLDLGT